MISKKTLVILAGGLGTRYNGLKQIDGILANGASILEYSIFDGLQAGFNKVVIIINPLIPENFKLKIEQNLKNKGVELHWVVQNTTDFVPENFILKREKPWGTAHALLCTKNVVKENFVVINADDFYGKETYQLASNMFSNSVVTRNTGLQIAFPVGKTISGNGKVSRGICVTDDDDNLVSIQEQTTIQKNGSEIFYEVENEKVKLDKNQLVSMNFWAFNAAILDEFEIKFQDFLKENPSEKSEFQLPTVIYQLILEKKLNVKVIKSPTDWKGVTYASDKIELQDFLQKEITQKRYPENLWN
ncbi:MAG: sugar phosphate nucleotidyltransferase [Cruoricaptor ignavus]|nr:sugar phosphate nucleotidyltransferase [Cruoricaptor ignavus]